LWGGIFVDARRGELFLNRWTLSQPIPAKGEVARLTLPFPGDVGSVSGAKIREKTILQIFVGTEPP
jgi:hypothetical protein